MTYDDPFIVRMNIIRPQSLLNAEIDDAARKTVCQILNEFEEAAIHGRRCSSQVNHL